MIIILNTGLFYMSIVFYLHVYTYTLSFFKRFQNVIVKIAKMSIRNFFSEMCFCFRVMQNHCYAVMVYWNALREA